MPGLAVSVGWKKRLSSNVLATPAVLLNSLGKELHKLSRVEGFHQVVVKARIFGLKPVCIVSIASDGHDERVLARRPLSKLLYHVKAIESGHANIKQHGIETGLGGLSKALFSTVSHFDLVAHDPEQKSQAVGGIRAVIGH
jgi:hypothetical protein